ncbi:hypothetical protein L6R52_33175 [Myxococcota bacterium]|nr:hypothetical protein [Myxococcota bacterium]
MQRRLIVPLAALAALTLACGEPSVSGPDGGSTGIDSGPTSPPPAKPTVDATPARTPYAVLTLRGRAEGRRVIVEGGGNPIASTLLPDGSFCVDVPLRAPGDYALSVFAQAADGQISDAAGPIAVTFDPAAPGIPGGETCSGADPAGCPGTQEICDNNRDDDCNSLVDERDPDCASCTDDVLEPNDDPSAPRIDPGRYEGLRICPANEDYYGLFLRTGERADVRLFFVHAQGNLDLHLLGTDRRRVVARSTSLDDDESLTFTATTTGQLPLRVFSDDGASTTYTLDVRVTTP